MTTLIEEVYSPIRDKDVKKDISNSIIWGKAFKKEDLNDEVKAKYPKWYCYTIKFKGLIPLQVTKFKEVK